MDMKKLIMALLLSIALQSYADDHQNSSSFVADGEIGGYEYVNLGLPSVLYGLHAMSELPRHTRVAVTLHGVKRKQKIFTLGRTTSSLRIMILTRQLARMRFWNTSEKISVEPNMMQQLNNGEMAGVFLMTKKPMNCECIAGVNGPLKRA